MKHAQKFLCWLLIAALLLVCAACGKQEEAPAEEPTGPLVQAEEPAPQPEQNAAVAQPGVEEEDCPAFTAVADYAAAVQAFAEDAGYVFETTSTTGKSNLYTVCDGASDLVLLRVYVTDEETIDHFFVKFAYDWAQSDNDFAFVLRFMKFAVKSALAGMTNEDYQAMCDGVGIGDAATMAAYCTGAAEYAGGSTWTLTKKTGTLKTANYEDALAASELGFYIMTKESQSNNFALTVTLPGGGEAE